MSARDGEAVELQWDGEPEFWVVRGHVDGALAEEWAREECEGRDVDPPERFHVEHAYARWQFVGGWDGDRTHRRLVVTKPGRGAFRVTIAEAAREVDRLREIRERRERETASARQVVAERWPDAEIVDVMVQIEGMPTLVTLRVPGRRGTARWEVGTDWWHLPPADREGWEAWIRTAREVGP